MFVVLILACGEAPPAPTTAPDPHAGHTMPSPGPAPGAAASVHDAHGEHMAQMSGTRDRLRAELGAAYDAPVPGLGSADPAVGKAVYEANCQSCHGATGKGDGPVGAGLNPPASDMTDAFHARYYSDAGRVQIVRKGSPGTAMAGFAGPLTEDQIVAVYQHVAAFRAPVSP